MLWFPNTLQSWERRLRPHAPSSTPLPSSNSVAGDSTGGKRLQGKELDTHKSQWSRKSIPSEKYFLNVGKCTGRNLSLLFQYLKA